ncbi:MAG TPA: LysE family transporter [Rhizomicrobium sp.]|nr:LysE family transporter [Rhizomicrobium sp.]
MSEKLLFISLSLALLLTPGPTNTLLLVGGATKGLRRSLWLMPAELMGYLTSIHILAFSLGAVIQHVPAVQILLRLTLSLYLALLAVKLWVARTVDPREEIVTPTRVFAVTLLNPKAMIFTFVVLPPLAGGHWLSVFPRLALLSGLILAASFCWISLGAAMRTGQVANINPAAIRRFSAAVLLLFAATISSPSLLAFSNNLNR